MSINQKNLDSYFETVHSRMVEHGHDRDEAADQAFTAALNIMNVSNASEEELEKAKALLFFKYKIGSKLSNDVSFLEDSNKEEWYAPTRKTTFFFWDRYRRYLQNFKKWDYETVHSIDVTTDKVMEFLGDPHSADPFDKRGLVLGYVQSGKTANFTGLINKAYDVGYKLVIVLAGMHNDLRTQTQIRLESEVVGIRTDKNGRPIGVSQVRPNDDNHIIGTWTTEDQDISSGKTRFSHLNKPTLMVVKKNKTVLESLIEQLENHKRLYQLDIPVLIIDDEADQASVDTSNSSKEEDPKTINSLIRQLLDIFPRRNYVGYTATPFANLLIDSGAETISEGKDLYPKDFLVGLPKPKAYCGPEEFFNTEEDADYNKPSLIRHLSKNEEELLGSIKKTEHAEIFESVPPQMREAILTFLLTIAIRNLRGQQKKHNSMLIHISRLKGVQTHAKEVINNEFNSIKESILHDSNSETTLQMKGIYEEDISQTSISWDKTLKIFDWHTVLEEVKRSAKTIQVFAINGDSKDALDYDRYKENGLNVIAIGGDKLSRGLTLEGLSITYYTRNTLVYDTLMQMGRWFGYREGYMDLCRIYTSETIAANFEHLAIAMKNLREEFDNLAKMKKTPKQYAIRMLSHSTMHLTNILKMKTAIVYNARLNSTLQQTRIFDISEEFFRHNMKVTNEFISMLNFVESKDSKARYHIARNVEVEKIINYLRVYKTSTHASKVQSELISNYIQIANSEKGELSNWTVAVAEGTSSNQVVAPHPIKLGEIQLSHTVMRGENAHKYPAPPGVADVRAIVAGNQEFIDLDSSSLVGARTKVQKRAKRPKSQGLLIIYPLNPNVELFRRLPIEFNNEFVPIGVAFSFPDTEIDDDKVYLINKTIKPSSETVT